MSDIHILILKQDRKKLRNKAKAIVGGEVVAEVDLPIQWPPICNICRILVASGYSRDAILTITREGSDTVLFKPSTVGYWADRTITEGDATIRMVKYRPRPEGLNAVLNDNDQ